jgi:hypothetical protein
MRSTYTISPRYGPCFTTGQEQPSNFVKDIQRDPGLCGELITTNKFDIPRPMAPTFTISPKERIVRVRYDEPATFTEWVDTMDSIIGDERFRPGFGFLIDRRSVPAPTAAFAESVANYLQQRGPELGDGLRSATVVADVASYGMAQIIQGMSPSTEIRLFTTLEEAEQWLIHG